MTEEAEKLSLLNLKGGAAVEMFELAWQRVMDNISDINTTDKPREIALKVKIKPSEDRSYIAYEISCDSKLSGQEPEKAVALVKIDTRGKSFAVSLTPKQQDLPFNSNITPINRERN